MTTKIIKIIVQSEFSNAKGTRQEIAEIFVTQQPDREVIKELIEDKLKIKLETRKYSPDEGGDFGAFFFYNDLYITYMFKDVKLIEII